MPLKKVVNADAGDADHWGGNDQDNLTTALDIGEVYMYLVKKSGSTYYVKNSAGEIIHSGATPATEIQWALDNCTVGRTHKEIVAIRGNITLTGLTIPSYTVLDLRGALIKQTDSTNTNFLINNDTSGGNTQIEIFGGTIDGNKAGQTADAVPYNTRNAIMLKKVTDSQIHDCHILNSNSSGIYFEDCVNVRIERNSIVTPRKIGCYSNSSAVDLSSFIFILDNYFDNTGENFIATSGSMDVHIEGNIGNVSGNSGINVNGNRTTIRGNYLKDCTTVGIGISPEGIYPSDYLNIIDNVIWKSKTGGINLNVSHPSDNQIIKGNKVVGATSGQSTSAQGIRCTQTHNTIIEGNEVWGWQRYGISLEGYTGTQMSRNKEQIHTILANNICYDNGINTGESLKNRSGILLTGSSAKLQNINVHGNICYDTLGGSGTQTYGIYAEQVTNGYIHDNDLRGNLTASLLEISTNVTTTVIRNMGYVPDDVAITNSDSPYTVLSANSVIRADATSGAITITLPTAVGITNKTYTIKRVDLLTNSNLVTIATTSSQTIGGATNAYLWSSESIVVESDNANWVILARNEPTSPLYYMIRGSRRYYAGNQGLYGSLLPSTTSPAANTLWALGFIVPKTTKFSTIAFNVTTGAAINARCGIYRDNNACYPGALIFDTGAIDCTATGSKDTTITAGLQVLPAGLYWLAWECASSGTMQIHSLAANGMNLAFLGYAGGSANAGYGYSVAHTFGALPDPYTAGASILTAAPAVGAPVPAINLMPI